MHEYFVARNLIRILNLDTDPLTINNPVPQVAPGFDWAAQSPQDLDGDRLCRFFLLQNMAPHLVPSLELLPHASQIWRALKEVSSHVVTLVCSWIRVMLDVSCRVGGDSCRYYYVGMETLLGSGPTHNHYLLVSRQDS